nr:ribonuclease H-like domain-containing protein [Tanacetum cinerariifolium]
SIPNDHVADFHYMNDARDIWNAIKARFGGNAESKKMRNSMLKQEFSKFKIGEAEGLDKGYDRMQKILSQLNQLKAKPENEDINLKFLRALPSSWSQVALTLKTKADTEEASTAGYAREFALMSVTSEDTLRKLRVTTFIFHLKTKSERTARAPNRLCLNMKVEDDEVGDLREPANYKTVMLDPDKVIWQGAMDEEMKSMKVNKVWIVVDRPPNAKDGDFYEKQMENKTVGIGVGPVYNRNEVNYQNQFVPQAVLLRTGKVNIPHARPQPVPIGKAKVFAPVPADRQNRPFLVPTDRGHSPS